MAKFLSDNGVASRRESERLIESGAVSVNGEIITAHLAAKAENVAKEALVTYLERRLPVYMIPRVYKFMDELPLDERTGKVKLASLRSS